jgi:hypothetical protein
LAGLWALGHHIDTSGVKPAALREWVRQFVKSTIASDPCRGLTLLFESFGFKNGIPLDADLVFDVRCLPNPHYDPNLRPLTGRDAAVVDFLEAEADVLRMRSDIARLRSRLAAGIRSGQSQLPDRGHRLHRWSASVGVFRRMVGARVSRLCARTRQAPRAGVRPNPLPGSNP